MTCPRCRDLTRRLDSATRAHLTALGALEDLAEVLIELLLALPPGVAVPEAVVARLALSSAEDLTERRRNRLAAHRQKHPADNAPGSPEDHPDHDSDPDLPLRPV